MSDEVTRRRFIRQTEAVVGGLALAGVVPTDALGKDPKGAQGNAGSKTGDIKLGMYSMSYSGVFFNGPGLTMEEVIQRAKKYGYQGIELSGKRPHGNPLDMPKSRCAQLRKLAADNGVPIYAVAGNNDFSSSVMEHRECQLVYMRELIRMASDVGAKLVRVLLAWVGVAKLPVPPGGGDYDIGDRVWETDHEGVSAEENWARCRDGLKESVRWAREFGVTLALQNHPVVLQPEFHKDVLRMVHEVDSPNLKMCLDSEYLAQYDEAHIRESVAEVGSLQMMSHFGGDFARTPDGKFTGVGRDGLDVTKVYPVFIRALLDNGFQGHVSYECCHNAPVVNGMTMGIEFPDNNARHAAEYLLGVIAQAKKEISGAA